MLISKFPSRILTSSLSRASFPSTIKPVSSFNIVKTYVRRSDIFEVCVPYDDHWVPSSVKKKKRLPIWDDPNTHWPPLSVRPTQHRGKRLIAEIQREEIDKIT